MNTLISTLPTWQIALLVIGSLLIFSLLMVELTYRYFMVREESKTDLISLFSSSSGVLYSVLLALITVNAWQDFNDVQAMIDTETYTIGDLYRDLEAFPDSDSRQLQTLLRSYVGIVENEEFPAFRAGERNHAVRRVTDEMFMIASRLRFGEQVQHPLQAEVIRLLNQINHTHRMLRDSVDEAVLPLLWWVVWIGGFLNLAINALSASGHRGLDYFLVGSYAINIGLVILLIFMLDHPFMGDVHVSEEPFLRVLDLMDYLDQEKH